MNSKIPKIDVKTLGMNFEILILEGIILQNTLSSRNKVETNEFYSCKYTVSS